MPGNSISFLGRKGAAFLAAVIAVKVVLLCWSAHPFDFWTFVNTIQRSTLFGWNAFEFWNKGNLLILIWYPMYSLYLVLAERLSLVQENLPLLFFFFKVPFLFIDLAAGFLLARITYAQTASLRHARWIFWGWFLNPIVYYVYGVHGHYELLVPFSFILIMYGLTFWKPIPFAAGAVISFTTKYFVVIFFPFFLLYAAVARKYALLAGSLAVFAVGTALSYAHALAYPELFSQTLGSILSLSAANAPDTAVKLTLPPLNAFSALNSLVYPASPINSLDNPALFSLANHGLMYAGLAFMAHFAFRLLRIRRTGEYGFASLVTDCFFLIGYLMCFLTNFQPHYLAWLLPFFLLAIPKAAALEYPLVLYTLAGTLFTMKNEIGPKTFFMDILPVLSGVGTLDKVEAPTMYGLAAVIIVSTATAALLMARKLGGTRNGGYGWLVAVYGACWFFIAFVFLVAVKRAELTALPHELAYVRNSRIYPGVIYSTYPVSEMSGTAVTFNDSSESGGLFNEEAGRLTDEALAHFHAHVMVTAPFESDRVVAALEGASLNGCALPAVGELQSLKDHRYYPAFEVPVTCLKVSDNTLLIAREGKLYPEDIALYASNEPVSYRYLPSMGRSIRAYAAVGLVGLAAACIITFFMYKRTGKGWK